MRSKKKKRLKCCIFSQYGYSLYNPTSKSPFSGAEIQLFFISKQLAKFNSIEVHVITSDVKSSLKRIEKRRNLYLHLVIPQNPSFINYIKAGFNLLICLHKIKPDLILQRGAGIPTFLLVLFSIIYRNYFIFSIAHLSDVVIEGGSGIINFLYKFSLIFIQYLIAQNDEQVREICKWKTNRDFYIKRINSGYPIENFEIEEKTYILWVGRAIKWKRPELFLQIAKLLPQYQFIMICNTFNDNYSNYIIQEVKKVKNLKFLSFVKFGEIDQYFKHAKLFVNTSIAEGFPNTFIQAAKNKTPIISMNVNPNNFLEEYQCGFICDNSLKEIIQMIILLFENDDLYSKMSKNCFNYAKKKHDLNEIGKEWKNLIESIVK